MRKQAKVLCIGSPLHPVNDRGDDVSIGAPILANANIIEQPLYVPDLTRLIDSSAISRDPEITWIKQSKVSVDCEDIPGSLIEVEILETIPVAYEQQPVRVNDGPNSISNVLIHVPSSRPSIHASPGFLAFDLIGFESLSKKYNNPSEKNES